MQKQAGVDDLVALKKGKYPKLIFRNYLSYFWILHQLVT